MRIRLRPDTRTGRFLLRLATAGLERGVRLLGRSWRLEVLDPEDRLGALGGGGAPMILCHWHNRSILAAYVHQGIQRSRGGLALLASRSRDGELVARVSEAWGAPAIRGSSGRGGAPALLGAIRAVRRQALSPVVAPDGPRGPAYEVKSGVVALARASGAPILCLGFAAARHRALGSWDRLIVPAPFTRVVVVVGEPVHVPRGASDAELETARQAVEAALVDVNRRAERRVGATDPLAAPGASS